MILFNVYMIFEVYEFHDHLWPENDLQMSSIHNDTTFQKFQATSNIIDTISITCLNIQMTLEPNDLHARVTSKWSCVPTSYLA